MRSIKINLYGELPDTRWGGKDVQIGSAAEALNKLVSPRIAPIQLAPLQDIAVSQKENQMQLDTNPLAEIVDNNDNYAAPIKLPKLSDPMLSYAAPLLNNSDYYVEQNANPIIGSASNKTLGSFPIFSSTTLLPAGLWDKRRKAYGDMILALEQQKLKNTTGQDPNFKFDMAEGSPSWDNAFNSVAIDKIGQMEQQARQMGVSLRDADKVGHPLNQIVLGIIKDLKTGINTVRGIESTIKDIETKNLNLNNRIGARANAAISLYKDLSALPDDAPIEFGGKMYNGKKELADSKYFRDAMYELYSDLSVDADLLSVAAQRASQIEEKIQKEYEKNGGGMNYIEFKQKRLESKYPLYGKKNPLTGEQEMSTDTYLDALAAQIMQSRPNMFKETAKDKEAAEYTKDDIKSILRTNLGYEYEESPYTVTGIDFGGGGSGSKNQVINPAPDYIKSVMKRLDRGEVVTGKSGKAIITSGDAYTTYIINGQTRVVPNSNIVENAKLAAEAGAADGEYGNVDYPTAILQMENADNRSIIYSQFKNSRLKYSPKLDVSKNQSVSEKFNSSIKAMSGENGAPVGGNQEVWVKNMNGDKNQMYFTLRKRDGGQEFTGILMPKSMTEVIVSDQNAGFISKFFGWNENKAYVPEGNETIPVSNAYYKKSEEKDGTSYYVVYDKSTNSPMKFNDPTDRLGKRKTEIKVPSYFVENIINTPEKLINDANSSFEENVYEPNTTMVKSTSEKTKTGGSGTGMGVEHIDISKLPDSRKKLIKAIMDKNKSITREQAIKLENDSYLNNTPEGKNKYSLALKGAENVDITNFK